MIRLQFRQKKRNILIFSVLRFLTGKHGFNMKNLIYIFLCIFTCNLYAAEFKLTILGPEATTEAYQYNNVIAINDNGQVLGTQMIDLNEKFLFVHDPHTGFDFVEEKDHWLYPLTINNSEQVLGVAATDSSQIFLWSDLLGFRWINVFDADLVTAVDLNDAGQVIGIYDKNSEIRPFLWEDEALVDMGPGSNFAKKFEDIGYHIMDIVLSSINNKGELTGRFSYGEYNKKKRKYVVAGTQAFYFDGEIHLLPLKNCFPIQVNNSGVVLIESNENHSSTYLWDINNGLRIIHNFIGYSINDSSVILGKKRNQSNYLAQDTPAVWREGVITTLAELLGVTDINCLTSTTSGKFRIDDLTDFVDINNLNQIACIGHAWGDISVNRYACILEPFMEDAP